VEALADAEALAASLAPVEAVAAPVAAGADVVADGARRGSAEEVAVEPSSGSAGPVGSRTG
jgi:hypothetical protein